MLWYLLLGLLYPLLGLLYPLLRLLYHQLRLLYPLLLLTMWLVVAVQTAHRSVSNVISITWIESPEGCFRLFHSVCYKSGISLEVK